MTSPSRPLSTQVRPFTWALCALGFTAVLAGCASPAARNTPPPEGRGPFAVARLLDPAGRPMGRAAFTPAPAGVEVMVEVDGMTPGPHGLHVHTGSDCAPGPDPATGQTVAFGAAGGHFDPGNTQRHGRPGASMNLSHGGDAPNIEVGADGRGQITFLSPSLSAVPGSAFVIGRTLVIHEKVDDYQTNPAGNSGARIACGPIVPAQARPPMG